MATPINAPLTGDIWHLSIDDLLAPLPQTPRLGGPGPFVINLSASTAPIGQPSKGFADCEHAHVYQIQRVEDRRVRYRLRLGPFASEDEADAVLEKVRDMYPSALTATAEADDVRAIATAQAKIDALRSAAVRALQEATAARHLNVPPPIPVLTAVVAPPDTGVASPLSAAPKSMSPPASARVLPARLPPARPSPVRIVAEPRKVPVQVRTAPNGPTPAAPRVAAATPAVPMPIAATPAAPVPAVPMPIAKPSAVPRTRFSAPPASATGTVPESPQEAGAATTPDLRPVEQLSDRLPSLETTQTVRALTPLELEDDTALRWFVIQLSLSEESFDPDNVPNLDIFSVYRLYSVAGFDQGGLTHALRLGFFSEEVAAGAVASYLGAFFDKPTVKRVSVAERERFADQQLKARKDIGATGKHAVIEITSERVVRESRKAAAVMPDTPSQSQGVGPRRAGKENKWF